MGLGEFLNQFTTRDRKIKEEVYRTIFETWRSQVNSYWQRQSFFAAFETAALAGCWYVVEHFYFRAGLAFSVLGLSSAYAWYETTKASHRYIRYWWNSLAKIESHLSLSNYGFDFVSKQTGSDQESHLWGFFIPLLFIFAWVVVGALSVWRLWFKC
jgi:hypothetical protein